MIFGWSLAARAVLALGLAAGGFVAGARWVQSNWNAERLAQAELRNEAERMARQAEQRRAQGAQEALNGYARNVRTAQAAAGAAQRELDGLRGVLYAPGPAASDPAAAERADDAARARYVAGSCAGALVQVAEAADACEARLGGLQDWVRAQRAD
jgi:hypothetical protein